MIVVPITIKLFPETFCIGLFMNYACTSTLPMNAEDENGD